MTATEKLRRLLDVRGIEWYDGGEKLTTIPDQDGVPQAWIVYTWPSGKDIGCLWVKNCYPLTPAQAVEAMLGPFANDREKRGFEAFRDGEWVEASMYRSLKAQYDELKATLGRGKCKVTKSPDGYGWRCDCGNFFPPSVPADKYCPQCGRKVER